MRLAYTRPKFRSIRFHGTPQPDACALSAAMPSMHGRQQMWANGSDTAHVTKHPRHQAQRAKPHEARRSAAHLGRESFVVRRLLHELSLDRLRHTLPAVHHAPGDGPFLGVAALDSHQLQRTAICSHPSTARESAITARESAITARESAIAVST